MKKFYPHWLCTYICLACFLCFLLHLHWQTVYIYMLGMFLCFLLHLHWLCTYICLWVYYKAELGGRGAGQSRQSLSQRKESGSRELTPAGGTCSPRSLRTASLWADAWNRKAQPNQQSRPAAPLNPQLRPAQPAELPPPVWAA